MFLLFLLAPTVIIMIDKSADVSVFYTTNEEEEKKGQEKDIDKELVFCNFLNTASDFDSNETENNLEHFLRKYSKPHLNLIIPPPDFS